MTAAVLVPGLGGATAVLAAAVALAVSLAVGVAVGRASGRHGFASAAAFTALAFFALTRFPDQLHTRQLQWNNQRPHTRSTAMETVERENGVSAAFLAFAARRIPLDDSFAVVTGPGRISSAPQSLAQFELMPRQEEYGSTCAARWVLFFDHAPRLTGVPLTGAVRFAPGTWLAKVKTPCTR